MVIKAGQSFVVGDENTPCLRKGGKKKVLISLIQLVTIATTLVGAQPTITTKQGTFVLKPPVKYINSSGISGVAATAELAGKALEGDIAITNRETSVLNSDLHALTAEYELAKVEFPEDKVNYDSNLDKNEGDLSVFTRDVPYITTKWL